MNIVFAGTPEFALAHLEAVHRAGHRLLAVYTQPDRPAGRGRETKASPVKRYALEHDLGVRQPVSLKSPDEQEWLRALQPELVIVVAYGLILPRVVLDIPRLGCLNVHASLLPRWRGAAPIPRAIEAGDAITGVTLMQMDEGLDTGAIRARAETPIFEDDTAASLHDRLSGLGARLLTESLEPLGRGALPSEAQDERLACYAAKLRKDEALMNWHDPATLLARKVRAFNPWPVAHTRIGGKLLRIWDAEARPGVSGKTPGSVLDVAGGVIRVQTGDGELWLKRLQIEGGRTLGTADFLNGHPLPPGTVLGGGASG